MANGDREVWRLPQRRAVDAVRWLPATAAAWDRFVLAALWDADTGSSSLDLSTLSFEDGSKCPSLELKARFPQASRVSALRTVPLEDGRALVAYGSILGSVGFLVVDALHPSTGSPIVASGLHDDVVSGVDLQIDTRDCVSVGEDGKVNLLKLGQSEIHPKCMNGNHGLVSFSAVHWASPVEFVTAGLGAPLQWWDHRRPDAAVSQCPIKWDGLSSGIIHSIDVHPSRKHVCVVGGSGGSVLAWDLRRQQELIRLGGVPANQKGQFFGGPIVESEVWEVKYENFIPAALQGKIPPVMICSEDGVLAVMEGDEVSELVAEPCAINTFDIDPTHGKDIICGLEHESILLLKRDLR